MNISNSTFPDGLNSSREISHKELNRDYDYFIEDHDYGYIIALIGNGYFVYNNGNGYFVNKLRIETYLKQLRKTPLSRPMKLKKKIRFYLQWRFSTKVGALPIV